MSFDRSQIQRYLLGGMPESEQSELEQEYFGDADALERVSSVEEELIEDYLGCRLRPDVRAEFERSYLAAPHHRAKVETIRMLTERAATASGRRTAPLLSWQPAWLLAAAAVFILAAGVFVVQSRVPQQAGSSDSASSAESPAAPKVVPEPPPAVPRAPGSVVAMTLSTTTVRGRSSGEALVVPAGTDVVQLRLEGEPGTRGTAAGSVVVRTVSGAEVWRGVATSERGKKLIARVEIPAATLVPDDYIIDLSTSDDRGSRPEVLRYFLRVRSSLAR